MLKTIITGLLSAAGWLYALQGYWPGAVSCFCCAFVFALIPSSPGRKRP